MNRFLKTVLVAASIVTAGIATTSTASAGGANFSITIGSGGHGGGHWGGPRRNHGHWGGPRRDRGFCSPHQALNKARRMGIRHARVVNANHRVVKVRGRNRGHRVNAVFANTWRCPVVRFR